LDPERTEIAVSRPRIRNCFSQFLDGENEYTPSPQNFI
jgi:hypothetical protein